MTSKKLYVQLNDDPPRAWVEVPHNWVEELIDPERRGSTVAARIAKVIGASYVHLDVLPLVSDFKLRDSDREYKAVYKGTFFKFFVTQFEEVEDDSCTDS